MFAKKESVLINELTAFTTGISADNAKYQVSAPDAATMQAAVDDFKAKYTIWHNPSRDRRTTPDSSPRRGNCGIGGWNT